MVRQKCPDSIAKWNLNKFSHQRQNNFLQSNNHDVNKNVLKITNLLLCSTLSNTVVAKLDTANNTSNTLLLGKFCLLVNLLDDLLGSSTSLEVTELVFITSRLEELFRFFSTNLFVNLGPESFKIITVDTVLLCDGELDSKCFFIFSKLVHVICNVTSEDVLTDNFEVNFCITGGGCTGETRFTVGNVKTTITCTLDCSEETCTSSGTLNTDIKNCFEGTTLGFNTTVVFTREFFITEVEVVIISRCTALEGELEVCVDTTCKEETNCISCSPAVETELNAITLEFMAISNVDDTITTDVGSNDCCDNITVGETNNKTVLRCSIFVLILPDKTLTCIVIGLVLTTTAWLNLETLEICVGLCNFNETLGDISVRNEYKKEMDQNKHKCKNQVE